MKFQRSKVLRASLALAAMAAGLAASLAFTAPAQAHGDHEYSDKCASVEDTSTPLSLDVKNPQEVTSQSRLKKLCDGVTFTNKCDGTIDVGLDNTDGDFPVRFSPISNGEPLWIVLAGTSQTQNYDPGDKGFVRIWVRVHFNDKTFWFPFKTSKEWTAPAGCLKVTALSTCQNTFTVAVENTAPVTETFAWQKVGSAKTSQDITGHDKIVLGTFTSTDSVVVTVDEDNVLPAFAFVKPKNCTVATTPAPTTTPPVVAPAAPLPVTGSSLTLPLSAGTALVAVAMFLGIIAIQRRRRLAEATGTPSNSGDDDLE